MRYAPVMRQPPDREFAQVSSLNEALTQRLQHFNTLQGTIRATASGWLLATFAGVGFALTEQLATGDGLLMAAAVALFGSVGTLLLWNLDLLVYHPLLDAVFHEVIALEKDHDWLPQVAHNMKAVATNGGIRDQLLWFYKGTFGATVLLGLGCTLSWAMDGPRWTVAAVVPWVVYAGGVLVAMNRRTGNTDETFKKLRTDGAA